MSAIIDRIRPDYKRPRCAQCGQAMDFIHESPGGSRYACVACEFWMVPLGDEAAMSPSEASWIIRNTEGNEVQP